MRWRHAHRQTRSRLCSLTFAKSLTTLHTHTKRTTKQCTLPPSDQLRCFGVRQLAGQPPVYVVTVRAPRPIQVLHVNLIHCSFPWWHWTQQLWKAGNIFGEPLELSCVSFFLCCAIHARSHTYRTHACTHTHTHTRDVLYSLLRG